MFSVTPNAEFAVHEVCKRSEGKLAVDLISILELVRMSACRGTPAMSSSVRERKHLNSFFQTQAIIVNVCQMVYGLGCTPVQCHWWIRGSLMPWRDWCSTLPTNSHPLFSASGYIGGQPSVGQGIIDAMPRDAIDYSAISHELSSTSPGALPAQDAGGYFFFVCPNSG